MLTNLQESFLSLVRLGIGIKSSFPSYAVDWTAMKNLADQHGFTAVVLDGISALNTDSNLLALNSQLKLSWIGEVMQSENKYFIQQKASEDIALCYHENNIRLYVLKGYVISECYPKPEHRLSSDLDCFLLPENDNFDAWSRGNDIIKSKNENVVFDYYKNSTFYLKNLMVENHFYFTPFRGNSKLKSLEKLLQTLMRQHKGNDHFSESWMYKPPVMVSALFLIEHAYSHFLHEGLTWRHVLDWMMFCKKHNEELDWEELNARIDEFGFRKFYDSYYRLGQYLVGELNVECLEYRENIMLKDIWAPLDLHETVHGLRGKLSLVGNTWRARWKYCYFTDINWMQALWIQVKGFLFEKKPKLD